MTSLPAPTNGPLTVHPGNARYFADADGRAVLLTGSHTWRVLQDVGRSDPPPEFDWRGLLEGAAGYGHTFMRMWCWEQARWAAHTLEDFRFFPLPYERTGPGDALDGRPRFDLGQFDQRYFDRIRERVAAAGELGIYVAIMLFQGWSMEFKTWGYDAGRNPWEAHPFNAANNVNGVDGDPDGTGQGLRTHTRTVPEVNAIQEAYVRHVVDAVRDLDNVLFEVTNEDAATPEARDWQYWVIESIQAHERATDGPRHPCLMTAMWPSAPDVNQWLWDSPAEAVSPSSLRRYVGIGADYMLDPPAGDGGKVVIADTDHIWGIGGDVDWVWRAFMRGLNPIFMDPWDGDFVVHPPYGPTARPAMGLARRLADQFDVATLVPSGELVSSGFALAREDRSVVLAFQPDGEKLGVDLRGVDGRYAAEWRHISLDATTPAEPVQGNAVAQIATPYVDGSVLVLRREEEPISA